MKACTLHSRAVYHNVSTLLLLWDFSQKNSFTPCREKKLIGGHGLAVSGFSKFNVDVIFIIFREFNIMLEIVDSQLYDYS